jgi:hypothetical protein
MTAHNETKAGRATLKSTYIRKVGDGAFEYGWHFPNRNFRKASVFEPLGVATTVAAAEAKRADLAARATSEAV